MENRILQYNRRINYLLTETTAVYHEFAVRFGLSDSAMLILYALLDAGGERALLSLSRDTGLSKQTVNSALRKLEADGTVFLRPADKKSKIVCLTDAGKTLAARTVEKLLSAENEIYASWREEDLEAYLRLNARYLDDLRKKCGELERNTL